MEKCICRHVEHTEFPVGREGRLVVYLEETCPYHAVVVRIISQDHWSWARSGEPPWEFSQELVNAIMKAQIPIAR